MKLTDLGEKKIIKKLEEFLDIGDDAAYLRIDSQYLILAMDMIYSKTHIPPKMSWKQTGKFIVTVNFSDIAAMGARPFAFLLAYGGPDIEYGEFQELIKGVDRQCRRHNAEYAGGDTKYADKLTLAGTAVGFTEKPVLRSGAKPGDLIAVTGTLGGAALATDLTNKKLECSEKLRIKALEPEPRVEEGILLGDYASAMTDISDSLSMSLHDLAEKSNVGVEMEVDRIPLDEIAMETAEEMSLNLREYALHGGGDYELLFTIPQEKFKKIKEKVNATEIGRIPRGKKIIAVDGERKSILEKKGYEHFKKTKP
jgi:thiamine-monophosphate kinase